MSISVVYKIRSLPKLILKYRVQYQVSDQLLPFIIYIGRRVWVYFNHDLDNFTTFESLLMVPLRLLRSRN